MPFNLNKIKKILYRIYLENKFNFDPNFNLFISKYYFRVIKKNSFKKNFIQPPISVVKTI